VSELDIKIPGRLLSVVENGKIILKTEE